jgi:DNA-binding NarL/FixJ family response regulator
LAVSIGISDEPTTVVIQNPQLYQSTQVASLFSQEQGYTLSFCPYELAEFLACCSEFKRCTAVVEAACLYDSLERAAELLRTHRSVRVLVRGEGMRETRTEELIRLGCWGVVSQAAGPDIVKKAVEAVSRDELWVGRQLLSKIFRRVVISEEQRLSPREIDILRLLASDQTNKGIARQLFISPETLRWHLRNLYNKTGVRDRRGIVSYARELLGEEPGRERAAGSIDERAEG